MMWAYDDLAAFDLGFFEPKVGWTDEAREASIEARRAAPKAAEAVRLQKTLESAVGGTEQGGALNGNKLTQAWDKNVTELAQASGRSEEETERRMGIWSGTSGDTDPSAVMMQYAVQQEFGLDDAPTSHMMTIDNARESSAVRPWAKDEDGNRAYVRAEYERTQEFLKEHDIQFVSVYRGGASRGEGVFDKNMQPASSWSTNRNVAEKFARLNNGVVYGVRVPASRVLSTFATGRGTGYEREVILMGGPLKVYAHRP